jgi:NTP pyrophosphatase (non-canonical NTP hydrolase)
MDFQKMVNRAMDLRRQYEEKETNLYGSPSTDEDIAQAFAGDASNLVKFVLAEHGKRDIPNSKEKLEAQLAHCLWSVIVLSKLRDVDLEQSFMEAMDRLEAHLLETPD